MPARALVIAILAGCTQGPAPATWCTTSGQALGTTWTVKWSTDASVCDEKRVAMGTSDALAEVDRQMSTWREDSELSAVRRGPGAVRVSRDTAEVVQDALDLARATGGAYDPTVQPLMEVWGFHSRDRAPTAPSEEALSAARSQVGWERVRVGQDAGGPTVDAGGTALDLSSIAKGHAVDRVSAVLSRLQHADHYVEVGGEVRVHGHGPSGLWTLGIDAPVEGSLPGEQLAARVRLTNGAVASSGNYRNVVEVDGRRVHHTMDPRTGQPAVSDVASVTVIAPDCRLADGLATAVMVLGSDAGLALLEGYGDVQGLVLVAGSDGWTTRSTPGMAAYLPEP